MAIAFENLQKKLTFNLPRILNVVKAVLRHEGAPGASLSIVFVSSQRIKALNKKYLRHPYATDVLAFDFSERRGTARRAPTRGKGKSITGEIIISTDAAIKNSRIYRTCLNEEVCLYVIHGILHLLGFDDRRQQDTVKMRAKEEELLTYLGPKARGLAK